MSVLDKQVTVCGVCECACCWQGSFMCDYAEAAGTKEISVNELWLHPRGENPEYWFKDLATGDIDRSALAEFRSATN